MLLNLIRRFTQKENTNVSPIQVKTAVKKTDSKNLKVGDKIIITTNHHLNLKSKTSTFSKDPYSIRNILPAEASVVSSPQRQNYLHPNQVQIGVEIRGNRYSFTVCKNVKLEKL